MSVKLSSTSRDYWMNHVWLHFWHFTYQGLCFLGFVSACYEIARRKFYDQSRPVMLESFVDHCEESMQRYQLQHSLSTSRALARRDRSSRTTLDLFAPLTNPAPPEEESVKRLFVQPPRRQGSFLTNLTLTMKERQQRTYLPRTFAHDTVFQDD